MSEPLDLEMIAVDLAEVLGKYHDIDVDANDVKRGLVPFIDAIAPGRLTPEQRFGIGG